MTSALYRGSLLHARRDDHARRTFRYPLYVASLDLDELPALDRRLRLFSLDRPNLFSFYPRDYTTHRATRVITNLRVCGYTFNPVSFFLDFDARGDVCAAVAEVNNTYGGRHCYQLGPAQRVDAQVPTFRVTRELFVSPFLHGPASYDFIFDAPLDAPALDISMRVHQHGHQIFYARLAGQRHPLSDRALAAAALRYPLMTAQVIGLIHYEAVKMRLAGVPFRRPGPDHRPIVDLARS
jgi:DUF1365 family protein